MIEKMALGDREVVCMRRDSCAKWTFPWGGRHKVDEEVVSCSHVLTIKVLRQGGRSCRRVVRTYKQADDNKKVKKKPKYILRYMLTLC